MDGCFPALFKPIHIGGLEIKNRLVVPPVGTLFCGYDGHVCDRLTEYLTARAKGGFGLIIVEGVAVEPRGRGGLKHHGIWDDSFIPEYQRLTDSVHRAGAKIALQLMHAGRNTRPEIISNQQPVAPSAVADPVMRIVPKELAKEEITTLVEAFALAARRSREAGFDAVELHGGHGYLISEFMSGYANRRRDEYGGNLEGYLRFPLAILQRTRAMTGPDYPIIFRISADEAVPGGRTLKESVTVSKRLTEEGVDAIHASIGVYASSYLTMAPAAVAPGFNTGAAAAIKAEVSVPVIAVGRINDPSMAEQLISSGKADMVAIGRQSLADPEWPLKTAENRIDEIVKCLSCNEGCLATAWKTQPVVCVQNPALGREAEYASAPDTAKPLKILVAGGGPAGLEAARTAAQRGHQVSLFEKETVLGGQAMLAAIPPTKEIWKEAVLSRIKALERLDVKINLGLAVTPQRVKEMAPDVVIIATGSEPLWPDIPGIESRYVTTAKAVFEGEPVGDKIMIIGGGLVGCETADYLAQQGKDVTIIEMLRHIAKGAEAASRYFLLARLKEKKVKIITSATVKKITGQAVTIMAEGEENELGPADKIVLATGARAVNSLESALQGLVPKLYIIGDAARPGRILEAVQQAAETARTL